jgi:glucose/arabinose dehydrogenase
MRRSHSVTRLSAVLITILSLVAAALVTLAAPVTASAAAPRIKVNRIVSGLSNPWDVTWVGSTMLFDQRSGGVWSKRGTAAPRRVSMPLPRIYAVGEAGMMGIVADPGAARNRIFYTCMAVGVSARQPKGVEVWKWRLDSRATRATKVQVLLTGIPLNDTGRHSGCRLRFRSTTMLYVSTGDATGGTNPQNLQSLGGKVLRVRSDGSIPTTNPFYSRGRNARYVYSFGHRNVQGLARRPGSAEMWSVEQGTSRDDEVNRVFRGDNYGWNPAPGYDESHAMTDTRRHPGATSAKWRSGSPTVATCGATFLSGSRWQSWNGVLAVAMLKGQGVKLMFIDRSGKIYKTQNILRSYGRIRTVQQGPDGALYFTTSKGSDDGIYRVTAG